jgi:predicted nucleotidyltransferase
VYLGYKKKYISKQEIKEKVREAIENSSFEEEIKKVSLFGSYLHGDAKETSDVNVLMEQIKGVRYLLYQ